MTDLVPINETWLSGKPYYCATCGLGFAEFMACEEVDCELETVERAQGRLHHALKARHTQAGDGE